MVDTALLWIGLLVLTAVVFGAVAARRFAATGERPLRPLAIAAVALAGVFQLGEANDYFRPQEAEILGWAFLLVAFGLATLHFRERWRAWGGEDR